MSNHPVESGTDLLGRWLAHHAHAADDDTRGPPRTAPLAARPSAGVAPLTRQSASAALAGVREARPVGRHALHAFEPMILGSVLPGPDTSPSPQSVLPEQQDDGEEPDMPATVVVDAATKRRLVTFTKRSPTAEPQDRQRRPLAARHAGPASSGTGGAAHRLLAAARAATPAPAPAPAAPAYQTRPATQLAEPVPTHPVETVTEDPVPSVRAMEMPAVYEFAPRKTARRFLSLMLIAGLAASGYLDHAAYLSRDSIEMGIAGIVTLVTLVIWAIRAGATVTRLTVRRGQLEIVRQGGRMVFDLASTYTSIKVTGKPGSKQWKVQFLRPGLAPVVVDSTMVDGREFMRILTFFRPELAA